MNKARRNCTKPPPHPPPKKTHTHTAGWSTEFEYQVKKHTLPSHRMRSDLACETHVRIHLETFQCFTLNTEDCSDVPGVGVVLSRATQRKSPSCSFRTSNCTPEKEIKNKAGPYKKLIIFSTPMYTTLTKKKCFLFSYFQIHLLDPIRQIRFLRLTLSWGTRILLVSLDLF